MLDFEVEWNDLVLGGTKLGDFYSNVWTPRFKLHKHSIPSQIKHVIGVSAYQSYMKFVVVRHPIDRLKSTYSFLKAAIINNDQWIKESRHYKKLTEMGGINDFIESEFFNMSFSVKPEKSDDIQRFILPQSIFFDCKEFEEGRFKFFKLEDLIVKPIILSKSRFLKKSSKMPHLNKSIGFDEQILEVNFNRLIDLYNVDFKLFGYSIYN